MCKDILLLNPRLEEKTPSLAGDTMQDQKPRSVRDVDSLMKMYQLGSENSINTMKQMQALFGKTVDELSKQNHDLQQELIKSMKRQEREEKAREKEESSAGFDQMLSGVLPLLGQLAGQSLQGGNTPATAPAQPVIKPFPVNKNININRVNDGD